MSRWGSSTHRRASVAIAAVTVLGLSGVAAQLTASEKFVDVASGRPLPSQATWILVVSQPRDRPRADVARSGPKLILCSRYPWGMEQEIYGFLLVHHAIRQLMHQAAPGRGLGPGR